MRKFLWIHQVHDGLMNSVSSSIMGPGRNLETDHKILRGGSRPLFPLSCFLLPIFFCFLLSHLSSHNLWLKFSFIAFFSNILLTMFGCFPLSESSSFLSCFYFYISCLNFFLLIWFNQYKITIISQKINYIM